MSTALGVTLLFVSSKASLPVIGILSRTENDSLRNEIRKTWAQTDAGIVQFLIDAPTPLTQAEAAKFNDIVFLESPYSGRAVRFGDKLYRWLHHAARAYPTASWIGKSDDDVYADIKAVASHIKPHLSPLLYAGWLHGNRTLAPTLVNRMDEAFVIIGTALVQRISRRKYCVTRAACNSVGLIDTNYGGTSLGQWLSIYTDILTLPLNQHMILSATQGAAINFTKTYVINGLKSKTALKRAHSIHNRQTT